MSRENPNRGPQECHLSLAGNREYGILRYWAARLFLAGNSMKITVTILKERDFFSNETVVPENRSFH